MLAVLSVYIVFALNLFLALELKKSKIVTIITVIWMGVMFCMQLGDTGDHYLYKLAFENTHADVKFEGIFLNILEYFRRWVSQYEMLLLYVFIFCGGVIYIGWRKTCVNIHAAIAISIPYIYPSMTVTLRFTIAFAILLVALKYLISGKRIAYILGILIAASIHYAMFFALLYLWNNKLVKNKFQVHTNEHNTSNLKKSITRVNVVFNITMVVFLILIISKDIPFINNLLHLNTFDSNLNNKIEAYTQTRTRLGVFIFIPAYLASVYFSRILFDTVERRKVISDYFEDLQIMSTVNYYITMTSAFGLLMLTLNLTFSRLLYLPAIMNGLAMCYLMKNKKEYNKTELSKLRICFLLIVLAWFLPSFFAVNSIGHNQLIEGVLEYIKVQGL